MQTKGYILTITTLKGSKVKRFVKRLGEALIILSSCEWQEVLFKPLGERRSVPVKKLGRARRSVLCVETGEVFQSIRDCSNHYGIPYKAVWNCMTFGTSRKGLHFKDANDG